MTKTYIVPAFVLVDAESIEQADELACELAETLNVRRNLAPGTRLRLDEGKATIEAPEDFAGESLAEIEDAVNLELMENARLLSAAPQLLVATKNMLGWVELLVTQCMGADVDGFEIELINSKNGESVTVRLADKMDEARAAIAEATGGAA